MNQSSRRLRAESAWKYTYVFESIFDSLPVLIIYTLDQIPEKSSKCMVKICDPELD
jgi:hypothetical protein